jgi:hypothetical protein
MEFALARGRDKLFESDSAPGRKARTVRKGRERASLPEMQQTGTPMTDAQRQDTPQTWGTQIQKGGTQVKEPVQDRGIQATKTMQAAEPPIYEQGRESLQDVPRTRADRLRQRPLQALRIAGGMGVLLRILWQRS